MNICIVEIKFEKLPIVNEWSKQVPHTPAFVSENLHPLQDTPENTTTLFTNYKMNVRI